MDPINEIIKEVIIDSVKDLPVTMTPKDLYEYFNRNGHVMGTDRAYSIARKIGRRFGPGRRIYISKADFIKFVYQNKS